MIVTNLRVNGVREPIGFIADHLLCSWNVSDTASRKQINARLEVALSPDFHRPVFLKEDAELKQTGEPVQLPLQPRTRYYWRVTVWGDQGDCASSSSFFMTGKLHEPWKANWIVPAAEDRFHPIFRKSVDIKKQLKEAVLHVCGLGLFEAYIDGDKIGNEFFTPYLTDYESAIQVMTWPLGELSEGEHLLEIMLGKGWYMGRYGLDGRENHYGSRMAAIAELHLGYEDGSREVIVTDSSWVYRASDIEESCIYDGEIVNRYHDGERIKAWKPARLADEQHDDGLRNLCKHHLIDRYSVPVIVKESLPVREILHTAAGETVLDMGQNFTGYLEMKLCQPAGTHITLRFGEVLQNQSFYNGNYRGAKASFEYISGGREETVRTHFSFWGFRYVLIQGFIGEMRKEDFTGKVLYSDLPRTGWFSCGDQRVNRLYENTLWSMKSNFLDIPTDCPQRDERLGWTGDAQIFAGTACYHMDTRPFFRKHLFDLRCEQMKTGGAVPDYFPNLPRSITASSAWGDIAAILPDTLYQAYGSREDLAEAYPLMRDWVRWIDRKDRERGEKNLYDFGFHYGDWLALDGATPSSCMGGTEEGYIGSMYYWNSARIAAASAQILGIEEDAAQFTGLAEKIRASILKEYFTPTGRLAIPTQTGYLLALRYGIYPSRDKLLEGFMRRMRLDLRQIKCGFVGAPTICSVLAGQGMGELAYDLLLHEGFPGWLYEVDHGATTIWERWNSVMEDGSMNPDGMNSLNHYAYGSVAAFLYQYAAGIRPAKPGFTEAVIAPIIDIRLGHVKARYDSVSGTYRSEWTILENGEVEAEIGIPFGATATLVLPGYTEKEIHLEAGTYHFRYRPDHDFRRPYTEDTVLARVTRDPEACAVLKEQLPAVWQSVQSSPENGMWTLGSLRHLPFLSVDPGKLEEVINSITDVNAWRQQ